MEGVLSYRSNILDPVLINCLICEFLDAPCVLIMRKENLLPW